MGMESEMSKISEAAKAKACEMINAQADSGDFVNPKYLTSTLSGAAFASYIQAVSDTAKQALARVDRSAPFPYDESVRCELRTLILPGPVDPLLIEARQLVEASLFGPDPEVPDDLERPSVQLALAALRRGMDLARQDGAE